MNREEASLFFRLLNHRYEKASIILTSNKGFADWGEMFGDHVLATAILDRLLGLRLGNVQYWGQFGYRELLYGKPIF